jgi:hypothetical protein
MRLNDTGIPCPKIATDAADWFLVLAGAGR